MEKKKYSPEYKTKIVLEILAEDTHISEIASRESVSRGQLQKWKKEFLEKAHIVFSEGKAEKDKKKLEEERIERENELMRKVGQLTLENDWLKKKSTEIY